MEMKRCPKCNVKRQRGPCLRCKWTPKRIFRERTRLNLTQDMFAHALGVSWVTVARWESPIGSKPSKRNLALLEEKVSEWAQERR